MCLINGIGTSYNGGQAVGLPTNEMLGNELKQPICPNCNLRGE